MTTNHDKSWIFEVFYDGECPICTREIDFLKRRDSKAQIKFTDFTDADFSPSLIGRTRQQLDAKIHGRTRSGDLVEGVEVFRQLYGAIGWSSLVKLSRMPVIKNLLNVGYSIFAKNRLRLTGRNSNGCIDGRCSTDFEANNLVTTDSKAEGKV